MHYKSYDSFKTHKKKYNKEINIDKEFIMDNYNDYSIVIEVNYSDAIILYEDNIVNAKLSISKPINKVLLPGDKVVVKDVNNEYLITNLIKRTSVLSRIKKDGSKLSSIGTTKLIASNIDLGIIVVSCIEPPLHPKFIDRYLMILENSNIKPLICLNKCDLITEKEEDILNIYKNINIPVIKTSTYQNIGIDKLKKYINNKRCILVGNSGVGKSSITNALMNTNDVKTNSVGKGNRGRHTTTKSKYYILNDNTSIIDTPGIRSLDVSSFNKLEIQNYFIEFNDYKNKCKYKNCTHIHEDINDCMVKRAVKGGLINQDRYNSYVRIIKEDT